MSINTKLIFRCSVIVFIFLWSANASAESAENDGMLKDGKLVGEFLTEGMTVKWEGEKSSGERRPNCNRKPISVNI
jgi:hypothetical protein